MLFTIPECSSVNEDLDTSRGEVNNMIRKDFGIRANL